MRITVKCKNCGVKWVRVTTMGGDIEYIEDLMYNCPACGSNWYELVEEK